MGTVAVEVALAAGVLEGAPDCVVDAKTVDSTEGILVALKDTSHDVAVDVADGSTDVAAVEAAADVVKLALALGLVVPDWTGLNVDDALALTVPNDDIVTVALEVLDEVKGAADAEAIALPLAGRELDDVNDTLGEADDADDTVAAALVLAAGEPVDIDEMLGSVEPDELGDATAAVTLAVTEAVEVGAALWVTLKLRDAVIADVALLKGDTTNVVAAVVVAVFVVDEVADGVPVGVADVRAATGCGDGGTAGYAGS